MNGVPKPRNVPPPVPGPNAIDAHHVRYAYCENRPLYRRSRQLTAVKVYTVASESRHLLVFGVPQIKLDRELRQEFVRFGPVECVQNVTADWTADRCDSTSSAAAPAVPVEAFTDVFYVRFGKLEKARQAKKFLDAKNFYGGILHVSYAPERESVDELRAKLDQRRAEVRFRVKQAKRPATNGPVGVIATAAAAAGRTPQPNTPECPTSGNTRQQNNKRRRRKIS